MFRLKLPSILVPVLLVLLLLLFSFNAKREKNASFFFFCTSSYWRKKASIRFRTGEKEGLIMNGESDGKSGLLSWSIFPLFLLVFLLLAFAFFLVTSYFALTVETEDREKNLKNDEQKENWDKKGAFFLRGEAFFIK